MTHENPEIRGFLKYCLRNPIRLLTNVGSIFELFHLKINSILNRYRKPHKGTKIDISQEIDSTVGIKYDHLTKNLTFPKNLPRTFLESNRCRRDSENDVEFIFEKNRWKYLIEGKWNCETTNDEKTRFVTEWIDNNKDKSQGYWETYSTCERVCNLCQWLSCQDLNSLDASFLKTVIDFLNESAKWIVETAELHGVKTNNHILNNGRALVLIGSVTGNEGIHRIGLKLILKYLPIFVSKDGWLRERSSHYQLIVTRWIIDAAQYSSHDMFRDELKNLQHFMQHMIASCNTLLNASKQLDVLIGDVCPDFTPKEISILLSDYSQERPENKTTREEKHIHGNGWFKLSNGRQSVIGNFPQVSWPTKTPDHGHSDLTSFVWNLNNKIILNDIGRVSYGKSDHAVYQKSTLGHNIIKINDFGPACDSVTKAYNWRPYPYSKVTTKTENLGDGLKLQHNGFSRSTPVSVHERILELGDQGIKVIDNLTGHGLVKIKLCWHFGPTIQAEEKSGELLLRETENNIKIKIINNLENKNILINTILEDVTSQSYGEILSTKYLVTSLEIKLPAIVVTEYLIL